MRVTTETGLTLGFVQLNDLVAEVAYNSRLNKGLALNQVIRINENLWRVTKIAPSEYVGYLMVASLWRIE